MLEESGESNQTAAILRLLFVVTQITLCNYMQFTGVPERRVEDPYTGDFEQVPQLSLSFLLQTHQDLFALGHPLDHALHLRQQLHHALAAHGGLTV